MAIRVAVLIPTLGRARQASANICELMALAVPAGVEMLVIAAAAEKDTETLWTLRPLVDSIGIELVIRPGDGGTAADGWNLAYRRAHFLYADWFVLGADDIRFRDGWLAAALAVIGRKTLVVGLNDGDHTDLTAYAPHYMAHWKFTESVLGGRMVPEGYRAWWFDREVCERAQDLDAYEPAWAAYAEHWHPDWGLAKMDETYRSGESHHDADRAIYLRWREERERAQRVAA
jgi:hypothetical protein